MSIANLRPRLDHEPAFTSGGRGMAILDGAPRFRTDGWRIGW
jgi:hypothetical protein